MSWTLTDVAGDYDDDDNGSSALEPHYFIVSECNGNNGEQCVVDAEMVLDEHGASFRPLVGSDAERALIARELLGVGVPVDGGRSVRYRGTLSVVAADGADYFDDERVRVTPIIEPHTVELEQCTARLGEPFDTVVDDELVLRHVSCMLDDSERCVDTNEHCASVDAVLEHVDGTLRVRELQLFCNAEALIDALDEYSSAYAAQVLDDVRSERIDAYIDEQLVDARMAVGRARVARFGRRGGARVARGARATGRATMRGARATGRVTMRGARATGRGARTTGRGVMRGTRASGAAVKRGYVGTRTRIRGARLGLQAARQVRANNAARGRGSPGVLSRFAGRGAGRGQPAITGGDGKTLPTAPAAARRNTSLTIGTRGRGAGGSTATAQPAPPKAWQSAKAQPAAASSVASAKSAPAATPKGTSSSSSSATATATAGTGSSTATATAGPGRASATTANANWRGGRGRGAPAQSQRPARGASTASPAATPAQAQAQPGGAQAMTTPPPPPQQAQGGAGAVAASPTDPYGTPVVGAGGGMTMAGGGGGAFPSDQNDTNATMGLRPSVAPAPQPAIVVVNTTTTTPAAAAPAASLQQQSIVIEDTTKADNTTTLSQAQVNAELELQLKLNHAALSTLLDRTARYANVADSAHSFPHAQACVETCLANIASSLSASDYDGVDDALDTLHEHLHAWSVRA